MTSWDVQLLRDSIINELDAIINAWEQFGSDGVQYQRAIGMRAARKIIVDKWDAYQGKLATSNQNKTVD